MSTAPSEITAAGAIYAQLILELQSSKHEVKLSLEVRHGARDQGREESRRI